MEKSTATIESLALELLEDIYHAATEPVHWDVVVNKLVTVTGAKKAAMTLRIPSSGDMVVSEIQPYTPTLVNFSPSFVASYLEYFQKFDMWTPIEKTADLSHVVRFREYLPLKELQKTEFYTRWLEPQGINDAIAMELSDRMRGWVILNLHYELGSGFDYEQMLDLTSILLPHFRRAFLISTRLLHLQFDKESLSEVHNMNRVAIFLFDLNGKVTFQNQAAERILSADDGLLLRNGLLRAHNYDSRNDLENLLSSCSKTIAHKTLSPMGGCMTIPRTSGKRSYQLCVSPLSQHSGLHITNSSPVAVFVTDPDRKDHVFQEKIAYFFDLTPKESILADALVQGFSLREYAIENNVSFNTVRWHLRNILSKTQTQSQIELMKLLLNTPSVYH